MTSSPRAVPFLPKDHPYFTAYHFPAMARCDPDHYGSGWMNHQRSAGVRQAHRGEASAQSSQIPVTGLYSKEMHEFVLAEAELGRRAAVLLDEERREPDWFVQDARDRERKQGSAAQLDGQLPAEVHLTLAGIPVAVAAAIPTDHDLGFDREAD